MKRSFVLFCALIAGALSFSSCNKDLKDDINELKNGAGLDEPITVTTTFTDFKNAERTVTGTYKYKNGSSNSDALVKNTDGTYDVIIERSDAVHGDESVYVRFTYDPTTNKILQKEGSHYWEDFGLSNGNADFYEGDEPIPGLTFNIDVKNIDVNTGTVTIDVKVVATKEYSANTNSWSVPNPASGFTTTFSFNGKLKKYERSEQPN